jgi:hypothetical protein
MPCFIQPTVRRHAIAANASVYFLSPSVYVQNTTSIARDAPTLP